METQDGVDELPLVLRLLEDRHGLGNACLTLVGEGSRLPHLRAAATTLGVAERIRFTGQVDYDEVPLLLAEADICLDPAPGTELNHASTMTKIAEYMAAARPIVAYPLRETRRTAGDVPRYAELDAPESFADQIAVLAGDPLERADRARRGRDRAGQLTWERSEQVLVAAYERLRLGKV
jgi:glycosyltransferase involved in cell wall biosynthesis